MKLKDYIKSERLTQTEAAEKMGVTKQTWSSWINGVRSPQMATLQRMADVLHCQVLILPGRSADFSRVNKKTK